MKLSSYRKTMESQIQCHQKIKEANNGVDISGISITTIKKRNQKI